jgi:hypothetical protein
MLNDRRVREKTIENRRRRRDVAKGDTPVLGRSIRRNQRRRRFMSTDEDLEEILAGRRAKLLDAEVLELLIPAASS